MMMDAPQTLWIDWNDREDTMPTMVSAMTERSQDAHWFQRIDYAPATRIAELQAENARLREAMAYIATYPAKGTARRTRQGYPAEILYDEFAYKRMVDSYRDYARAALETKP